MWASTPDIARAIEAVLNTQGTEHAEPPTLTADEVQPETIPAEALFFDDFEASSTKLSDVWQGRGYDSDPDARN